MKFIKIVVLCFFTLNLFSQRVKSTKVDTIKIKKSQLFVCYITDATAKYPGGITELSKFISTNLKFPDKAMQDTSFTKCKVFVKFAINQDGSTSNFEVVKGCKNHTECDEETIRILKLMPKWEPAIEKNKPVVSYFNLPVSFKKD